MVQNMFKLHGNCVLLANYLQVVQLLANHCQQETEIDKGKKQKQKQKPLVRMRSIGQSKAPKTTWR